MTHESPLMGPARKLVELLAEHSDGLTHAQLTDRARASFPGLAVARIAQLLSQAIAAGAVESSGGRLRAVVASAEEASNLAPSIQRVGPLRAVVIDLESVVRTTAVEPFTDKRIFQLGAARLGADTDWVAAAPRFRAWVALPDDEWVITSELIRQEHSAVAVPAAEALAGLLGFAADADVVVAYNGTEADFPLLAEACDRENLPRLGGEYVDAYYLTLAVWPTAMSHRLAFLADEVGVPTGDLHWHDAAEDCVLLSRVLKAAASTVAGWPAERMDLLASVVPDSPAWRLMRELAGAGTPMGTPRVHSHANVAAIAAAGLAAHPPRRAQAGMLAGRGPVPVGESLRGADGRVDPVALAAAAHGGAANRRPAQEEMATVMHGWVDDEHGGLVEAPTGTGKSLAVLAVALDWLAADPNRTAIVSTYTKQLQAQLAHDVAALQTAVPGLLDAADLVKGAANRLSLRALLVALADATALDAGQRRKAWTSQPVRRPARVPRAVRVSSYCDCSPRPTGSRHGRRTRLTRSTCRRSSPGTSDRSCAYGWSRCRRARTASTTQRASQPVAAHTELRVGGTRRAPADPGQPCAAASAPRRPGGARQRHAARHRRGAPARGRGDVSA